MVRSWYHSGHYSRRLPRRKNIRRRFRHGLILHGLIQNIRRMAPMLPEPHTILWLGHDLLRLHHLPVFGEVVAEPRSHPGVIARHVHRCNGGILGMDKVLHKGAGAVQDGIDVDKMPPLLALPIARFVIPLPHVRADRHVLLIILGLVQLRPD